MPGRRVLLLWPWRRPCGQWLEHHCPFRLIGANHAGSAKQTPCIPSVELDARPSSDSQADAGTSKTSLTTFTSGALLAPTASSHQKRAPLLAKVFAFPPARRTPSRTHFRAPCGRLCQCRSLPASHHQCVLTPPLRHLGGRLSHAGAEPGRKELPLVHHRLRQDHRARAPGWKKCCLNALPSPHRTGCLGQCWRVYARTVAHKRTGCRRCAVDSVIRFPTQERPIRYLSQHEHRLPSRGPYRPVRPARVLWGTLVPMHLASSVGKDACEDAVSLAARRRTP